MTKRNLGKHYIWLSKRLDATVRNIFEENGKMYFKFEHRVIEVKFDTRYNMYVAEA